MENLDYTEGAGKQDRSFVFPVAASDTQKIAAADVRRGLMSTVWAENSPLLSSQQLTKHKQYEAGEEVQAADLGKVAFGETNPAAGEEGVIVSPSVNSQPNYTEADTHSPASCGSEKSLLRHSQSDQVHTSAEDMGKGSGVNASNQPLPATDTQQEKEKSTCSSLLYQMKKQQKQKAGRPFKKKTLMKMVKLLAIAQGWDSEATEIPKGNRCNDIADECQESKNKVKPEMPEAMVMGTSSDKSLGYNSTLDSIDSKMEDCLNTTPPENSEDIAHVSQIALPKPLMDLNKPCKRKPCKRNSKTTQRTKTPEMHSTTAPKDLSVPVEQGLTHGTLSLTENVCSFDKTPRNALMVQKKPLKQKALTLMEEMGLSQSDRLPALFQNNSATSHEKCPSLPTEVYLSDMKTGPVDLTFAGNMAVKRNSMKQRNQISKKNLISTECCSIHPGMPLSKPGENEPFETDVTPHYQVQSACNKVTINGAGACTTAVGIRRNMCMKTEEPGGKSIGDVLKLKRKPGRPFKKRTLLKMAKLMPQVHEDEVAAPKSQQDVTSLQPIKSKMKNKKDTKNPVSNVTPSRRSSRTNKHSQMLTEEMMHCLSQSPPTEHALPMSPGPAVSILKPEDAACTPSTASLIGIGSAELALQNESHSFDECNIKNTKIKKSIVTSEGSYHSKLTPQSKVLPEIVSTKKGLQKTAERKKTGIGAKNKCKQGGSVSEPLSLNGISQQNVHAHTDQDKMSCSLPTPTGTNHQKPCKRGIRHKKCKEEVIEVPTSISSVSQSQSGVPNLSASPEAPLLPSCVKTESDSEILSVAEKSNSKTSRDKRKVKMNSPQPSEIKTDLSHVLPAKAKTSRKRKLPSREPVVNAKRAIILRADATLGEIPSSQLGCDSAKYEKEALSSGTSDNLASKCEPHKGKGSRRKLKEADLTSNHDIKNNNFENKARVKKGNKGIIGKTDNFNLSSTRPQSEVNNAVADNCILSALEIVSTENDLQNTTKAERKKRGIGIKNKCKQGGSASEPLSLNGISQQNVHAHTDQDKMSCSLPTPTGTNHQKPCKRGIRHKKCKEEVIEVPTSISSVSQSQSGVPNLSASPEAPLLPSCVKTESDSEIRSVAERSNAKTSRDKRRVKISSPQPSEIKTDLSHVLPAKAKTSRKRKLPSREPVVNAKRAIILRADATLGEIPSSQLGCDSAKCEKEALSSGTSDNLASKREPHKGKGSRRKLKEADLTSNHDIKNSNFGKKARVKKGIIGKTDNLNHSQSEVNNAVAENNSIVPAQNPANTVKPKRKMSNLLSSCVSQPVPPAVASASEKEPMAQSDCPNSRKRKPRRKEKLCKKSPKPPRQKNKAGLGNTLSKNKQDPGIMFADTDTLVPEMEKGIEKKIEKKGTRNKGNLNMSSTHSQSEVNSADKSPNQNPSKLKVAAVSNKRQLTESDHPNSVKRKPLQKEKLSKKSIKPPRQKWKADLGNNVSEKVKTLGPKRKLVHGNNVSKDEDLEDVYTDVDNMLIDNEKGIQKKSEKKGRVQKILGKIDKGGSSTCPQSKGNSAVNKLISSAPNPNTGKRKLKSSVPLSCVSQPVPPAVASTRAGQMAESVSNDKMKREPQPKRRPCKKKPCQKDPPGLKRKVNNGKNLLTEKDLESLSVQGDKIVIATVKGRPKMECKAGKKVLELATSHEQENMVAALNESVSCSGTKIKNYSIFSGGTMVNSIEQKQDIVLLDSTDGSNRGPASQIANNSPDVTVEELKELCKTSLTKPPTKVAGLRKRFRRNRTGWDTRMKSKRHLSKLNSLNTVDVLPQTADNQTAELSFSSSLCNSMLDETIINTELNDQVGQSYNQLPGSTACQNKDVLCDQKKTLRKVRQQTLGKRYKAQREKGSPKRVHEEIETICAMSTANTDLLRSDVKPRKPIQCFFCGRSFRHISAYTVHRRIHTGEKPYRCVKCGKRFAQLYKLHLHANAHKQPEPIRCPCCSLMFPNTDEFIAHFNIHMKGTKKKPSSIKHKRDGRKIMAQPHADCTDPSGPRNTSTPLRCLSCLKEFVNNDTLKMHMLQTNCRGFMPYIHNVSEMKFNKSPSFNIHERSHGPVEPYASVCGKGFDQLKGLGIYSHVHSGEKAFFCAHCDQTFSSLTSLRTHQSSYVCSEKTRVGGSKVDIEGFLVEQGVGGQINTPMYFKCQICKQLHRHWCQYILHLRAHTKSHPYLCETCGQQYNQVPEICVHCQVCCKKSGEERACKASLSEVWQEPPSLQNQTPKPYPEFPPSGYKEVPSPGSTSVISCGSEHLEKQPAKYRSCLPIRAICSRYLCARCGKSFNQWNKLWLHQKVHKQKGSSFPCTQCSLEFRFFGSYRDHMQEHAAQSPFSCPLCPKAFVVEAGLNAHLCECHEPRERLKCDTCGKVFKSFRNLEKHSVLHKGASSHYCLPCNISFSSTCALQDHLKTHKARLDIPLPVGPVEPFLFPYHCRKCKARFTSPDLLQAHQVFHLGAVSDAADPVSTSLCSKMSKTVRQEVIPVSSQQKQILPVTKRKNLFRYPHPDRLYVVPIMSSEPPVIISDTEEDPQVVLTSPSTCNSPINNAPVPVHDGHSNSNNASMDVSTPRLPESTSPPVVLINDIETIQCTPASQKDTSDMSVPPSVHNPPLPSTLRKDLEQNVLPQSKEISTDIDADDEGEDDHDDDLIEASTIVVMPRDKKQGGEGFECVECLAFFTDVSELHEHYIHHARGV